MAEPTLPALEDRGPPRDRLVRGLQASVFLGLLLLTGTFVSQAIEASRAFRAAMGG